MTTLIINGVALSAILFRVFEYGISPNKVVVSGVNILIFTHLIRCRQYRPQHLLRAFRNQRRAAAIDVHRYFSPHLQRGPHPGSGSRLFRGKRERRSEADPSPVSPESAPERPERDPAWRKRRPVHEILPGISANIP